MKKIKLILAVTVLIISSTSFAQLTTDAEGANDYPLVSRFKGSVIQWYQQKNFDKYYLLKLQDQKLVPEEIEGSITRIQYAAGKEHSLAEISKSYETALKNAGFTISLTLDETNSPGNLNEQLYFGEFNGLNSLPGGSVKPDHNGKWNYIEASGQKDGKDIYIVLYITGRDWPLITFDAIEVKNIEQGLVTAQKIDKGISSSGHAVLSGVYFDTGKSTIKAESAEALKNIADYLKTHPDKKYFIVGHTDNTGDFQTNMTLSENRAKAAATELISNYGIDSGQIQTYGVASLAPVTSNRTDEGKARNRRIEIVEQ